MPVWTKLVSRITLMLSLMISTTMAAEDPAPANSATDTVVLPPIQAPLKTEYFPAAAIKSKTQGRVLVEFTISRRGRVDNVTIVQAEPEGMFDKSVRRALDDVRFTVPDNWESSPASLHHFRLSYVFKLYPCPSDPCIAPTPHPTADDSIIISIQSK